MEAHRPGLLHVMRLLALGLRSLVSPPVPSKPGNQKPVHGIHRPGSKLPPPHPCGLPGKVWKDRSVQLISDPNREPHRVALSRKSTKTPGFAFFTLRSAALPHSLPQRRNGLLYAAMLGSRLDRVLTPNSTSTCPFLWFVEGLCPLGLL